MLALDDTDARRYEPKRLRLRLFAVAGRLVHGGRRLHLRIPTRWPWAHQIITPDPSARSAGTDLTSTNPTHDQERRPAGPWNPAHPARQPGTHADHNEEIDLRPDPSADRLKVEKDRG